MENSGSPSRKRSSNRIGSSGHPAGGRSLINFFLPEPKRGRIEYRAMENISGNRTTPAPEAMVGSTDRDHEEPNLDLSLPIGLPRTIQNQWAQLQAAASEDERRFAKSVAVGAELARAHEENRFLKEKLTEANMEHNALHYLLLELTESRSQVGLQGGDDEQGGATVSPSSSDRTFAAHGRSSPSNPDRTQPMMNDHTVEINRTTSQDQDSS